MKSFVKTLRTQHLYLFTILVGLGLSLLGCSNDFKYVNRYEGNWTFTYTDQSAPFDGSTISNYTEYAGEIFVGTEATLKVHFHSNTYATIDIDKEGTILSGAVSVYRDAIVTGGFSDRKNLKIKASRYDYRTNLEFQRMEIIGHRE
jgi:hypothetical protein